MEIKQLIIVEGKTDTQKLKRIYGSKIETLETNGLGINNQLLSFIKIVNKTRGVIIFTDPDGPGKIIREKIVNYVGTEIKNAFIAKTDIKVSSKKIGIAEASDEAIINALNELISFDTNNLSLTWTQYLNNDFFSPNNRKIIAKHFGWDLKISSKTLFKWLNWSKITLLEIEKIMEQANGNQS